MKIHTKLLLMVLFFTFAWPFGLQGFNIPQNAQLLALSGAGIGGNVHPLINPAVMNKYEDGAIRFSRNTWLADVSGNQILINWNRQHPRMLTLQSWNINDLELRGEIPTEEPLAEFGAHWVSGSFSTGFKIFDWDMGMTIRGNYAKLFNEPMSGITIDLGTLKSITNRFSFGMTLKNMGYETSDSLRHHLPVSFGAGIEFIEPFMNSRLLADIDYSDDHKLTYRTGIILNWQNYFKFMAGIQIEENQISQSAGFKLRYRKLEFTYGTYFHESETLGTPQYFDMAVYF